MSDMEVRIVPYAPAHGGEIINGEELPVYGMSQEQLAAVVEDCRWRAEEAAVDYQHALDIYARRFGAEPGV